MVRRTLILMGVLAWSLCLPGTDARGDEGEPDAAVETDLESVQVEEIPLEWIEEMMENREMLESLDMLEKLELFEQPDLFSPHDF